MTIVVASTAGPPQMTTRAGGAERFFQWSMYMLLATGFLPLIGTGKLDPPSLAASHCRSAGARCVALEAQTDRPL